MSIPSYIQQKKDLYTNLLDFIESEDNEDSCGILSSLITNIETQKIEQDHDELKYFLYLLLQISNNHHRHAKFFDRISEILIKLKTSIKQTLTNSEIFKLFISNKNILLILFSNEIITVNDYILQQIIKKADENGPAYCHFFYPEIKNQIDEELKEQYETALLLCDENIFSDFDTKRKTGENDTYICNLIRNDSVQEFISYVSQSNIKLSGKIEPSVFETNTLFLNTKKMPTYIEYAAFYGSMQIIRYLEMNKVDLSKSLWIFAIHSQCDELINYLEEKKVKFPENSHLKCIEESLKCHHINIANYLENNYCNEKESLNLLEYSIHYHNYINFPDDFSEISHFYLLCKYNHLPLVRLFIETKDSIENLESPNLFNSNDALILQKDAKKILEKLFFLIQFFYKTAIKNAALLNSYDIVSYLLTLIGTKIDEKLFYECSNLTEVTIPAQIKQIGKSAFSNCKSLEEITFLCQITEISEKCFEVCPSLEQITIPQSVTIIKSFAFEGCKNLKHVAIPPSVTKIECNAFQYCSSLEEITIPELTTIESFVFEGCFKLKSIEIPSSVNSIKNNAFCECTSLVSVNIPDQITKITQYCFSGCKSLEEINLPPSLTVIECNSFSYCQSLKEITLPSSISKISKSAFHECTSLVKVNIPSSVVKIGRCAFNNCCMLESVTIPNSITKIKQESFCGCSSLKEVNLPPTVKIIDFYAFNSCKLITHIELPQSLTKIGEYAFFNCSSLVDLLIPDSVTEIDTGAFADCKSLTQIEIPASVEELNKKAFLNCTSLVKVSLSPLITSIKEETFYGCIALKEVYIPISVASIDQYAFCNCYSLSTISDLAAVTNLGHNAFEGCSSLERITLSFYSTKIGYDAFNECTSLKTIYIPKNVKNFLHYNKNGKLISMRIPDNLVLKDIGIRGKVKIVRI